MQNPTTDNFDSKATYLVVHSAATDVTTLGPKHAAALWVQGCEIGCSGCTSEFTWDRSEGQRAAVSDIAAWVLGSGHDRFVISGGEPFDQASALTDLIRILRHEKQITITCYSGYTLGRLERSSHPDVQNLLNSIDLLIDGPYIATNHAALLWRGSENQQLHLLSDRITLPPDQSVGVAVNILPNASVEFIGVPPEPKLFAKLQSEIAARTGGSAPARQELPFSTLKD